MGIHVARLFLSSTYNRETNNNVKVNNNARTLYEDCVCWKWVWYCRYRLINEKKLWSNLKVCFNGCQCIGYIYIYIYIYRESNQLDETHRYTSTSLTMRERLTVWVEKRCRSSLTIWYVWEDYHHHTEYFWRTTLPCGSWRTSDRCIIIEDRCQTRFLTPSFYFFWWLTRLWRPLHLRESTDYKGQLECN